MNCIERARNAYDACAIRVCCVRMCAFMRNIHIMRENEKKTVKKTTFKAELNFCIL